METPGPEAPGNSGVNQLWDVCRLRGPPKALHPPAHQGPAQAKAQLSDQPGRHDDHSASPVSLFPLRLPSPRPCGFGGKAEAEGLGQAVRSLAYAWLRPLCPSFPNVPPYAPAPLWGCSVGRLLTICALISLPGASWSGGAYQGSAPVRWAFRSPWARGGVAAGALALQGLEAASPFLGLHILLPPPPLPPHPCGLPSLPHQDTDHCMNSGLNGIISEFWSTASSGYFTNYLSLLCGGKNLGWGQVTDTGRPLSTECGGSESLATLLCLPGAPMAL